MLTTPFVDSHFHIYDREMPFVDNPRHRPDYDFEANDILALMDQNGVTHGVIAGASLYGTYHDNVIRTVRAHKRLRGTIVGDPSLNLYDLEQMGRDGIVGMRLVWISLSDDKLPDITSYEWRRTLRRIRDLDWHVHLHVGPRRLPAILPTIVASGVKVVLDHFGYPDVSQGLTCPTFQATLRALDSGRAWVKLSAAYRMGGREAVRPFAETLLQVAGPERLLWGSDAPFASFEGKVTYAETLEDLKAWVPNAVMRDTITGATPMALYFG